MADGLSKNLIRIRPNMPEVIKRKIRKCDVTVREMFEGRGDQPGQFERFMLYDVLNPTTEHIDQKYFEYAISVLDEHKVRKTGIEVPLTFELQSRLIEAFENSGKSPHSFYQHIRRRRIPPAVSYITLDNWIKGRVQSVDWFGMSWVLDVLGIINLNKYDVLA